MTNTMRLNLRDFQKLPREQQLTMQKEVFGNHPLPLLGERTNDERVAHAETVLRVYKRLLGEYAGAIPDTLDAIDLIADILHRVAAGDVRGHDKALSALNTAHSHFEAEYANKEEAEL